MNKMLRDALHLLIYMILKKKEKKSLLSCVIFVSFDYQQFESFEFVMMTKYDTNDK